MGQVLHRGATTTEAIRRAIQHSQESLRVLARRYGINPKTVAKWRHRSSVADLPTGPGLSGCVLEAEADRLLVAAGEGAVRLVVVQVPGKKPMPVADFLRGHRVRPGDMMRS